MLINQTYFNKTLRSKPRKKQFIGLLLNKILKNMLIK